MPGHKIPPGAVKNKTLFNKYQCHHCHLLLKDAVQPVCGHWMCESCAAEIFADSAPRCPRTDCNEDLQEGAEEGAECFPDRFVRREINALAIYCINNQKGCEWEGILKELEDHLTTCQYTAEECNLCGTILKSDEVKSHHQVCPKAPVKCPLAELGCKHTQTMTREELEQHVCDHGVAHLEAMAAVLKVIRPGKSDVVAALNNEDHDNSDQDLSLTRSADLVERDGATELKSKGPKFHLVVPELSPDQGYGSMNGPAGRMPDEDRLNMVALSDVARELKIEIDEKVSSELRRKDDEIGALRSQLSRLEKSMRSKHAEFEDRDFRLSLIENSNYDGSMIWKIPQFSQRMSDAQTGKYTSIFSLPFYTGRYGYKMCLRLYILGDGIGKNTHMSLFFVVMKGEFDNILEWPFKYKVTFKLINQTAGGKDIIDTFQPDPMSSSFRKPKSDMNIASGCPRFVSHAELKNSGFIVDDTVFIKCSVDCSHIKSS